MPAFSSNLDIGQAQDVGISATRHPVQEDSVQVEHLVTASGLSLSIGLVIDARSTSGTGKATADAVARQLLSTIKAGQGNDVSQILEAAMRQADSFVRREITQGQRQEGETISATVAAIHDDRLYLAHTGHTRAYLVRGDQVIQLTRDQATGNSQAGGQGLGGYLMVEREPQPAPGLTRKGKAITLKHADRILLCSDGLIKPRSDGQGSLLEKHEIAPIVNSKQTSALEAARTLVSLAVGRKGDDNVSAIIMAMPHPVSRTWLAIPASLGILCLLALFLPSLLSGGLSPTATPPPTVTPQPSPTPIPADNGRIAIGCAFNFENAVTGDVLGIGKYLQRGDEGVTTNEGKVALQLPDNSRLYLGADSHFRIEQLNQEGEEDQSKLTLLMGTILIIQPEQGAVDTISILNGNSEVIAVLEQRGTIGVSIGKDGDRVACLVGSCHVFEGSVSLGPGEAVRRNTPSASPVTEPADATSWNSLTECR
jgi:protein phosphatase